MKRTSCEKSRIYSKPKHMHSYTSFRTYSTFADYAILGICYHVMFALESSMIMVSAVEDCLLLPLFPIFFLSLPPQPTLFFSYHFLFFSFHSRFSFIALCLLFPRDFQQQSTVCVPTHIMAYLQTTVGGSAYSYSTVCFYILLYCTTVLKLKVRGIHPVIMKGEGGGVAKRPLRSEQNPYDKSASMRLLGQKQDKQACTKSYQESTYHAKFSRKIRLLNCH